MGHLSTVVLHDPFIISFLIPSSGAGPNDFLHGHASTGPFIHIIPSWYSNPGANSVGLAADQVPKSAGLKFTTSLNHSSSILLFTLTSLTLAPTNSVNLPDCVLNIPKTADET